MHKAILALSDNETTKALAKFFAAQGTELISFQPFHIQPLIWDNHKTPWAHIDQIIITSPYAVEYGLKSILNQLNPNTKIFTVGSTTAERVRAICSHLVYYPETFTSEALLALPAFSSVANTHWALLKGEGGRDLIEKTLLNRRAIVYTIPCYRREPVKQDLTSLLKIWQNKPVTACFVTSAEGFDTFVSLLPDDRKAWLNTLTFMVTSERLEKHLRTKGFERIIIAEERMDSRGTIPQSISEIFLRGTL